VLLALVQLILQNLLLAAFRLVRQIQPFDCSARLGGLVPAIRLGEILGALAALLQLHECLSAILDTRGKVHRILRREAFPPSCSAALANTQAFSLGVDGYQIEFLAVGPALGFVLRNHKSSLAGSSGPSKFPLRRLTHSTEAPESADSRDVLQLVVLVDD